MSKLLTKLMTLNPSQRPILEDKMKDHWLNMGQEEGLRLYIKLPWGDMDPQVTKIMKSMRFK